MKTLILTLTLMLILPILGFSETRDDDKINRNGLYAEAYMIRHDFSEGFASINYERTLGKKGRMNARVGIYPDFESTISFPITLTWITWPQSRHHIEYGIGGVFRIEHYVDPYGYTDREWFYDVPALMIPLMYRYQPDSSWIVRAGVNVFVSWPTLPSPSLSIGYRF